MKISIRFRILCAAVFGVVIFTLSITETWTEVQDRVTETPVSHIQVITPETEDCRIPSVAELVNSSLSRLASLYHAYLSKDQIICKQGVRLGKTQGGWDVCIDEEFRIKEPCIVYSFGVGKDVSFNEDIAKIFGCYTYAFDPGIRRTGRKRVDRMMFISEGINNYTGTLPKHRRLNTLRGIQLHFGHGGKTIDLITMDITPTEFAVIPQTIEHDDLQKVKQLNLRLDSPEHPLMDDRDTYITRLKVLRHLYFYGFRSWIINESKKCIYHSEVLNKLVIGCYEIGFLNLRYI